jgi:peptide chain release factor 2
LNEVNAALENPAVWNEPKRAQELGKEKKTLETVVDTIDHLSSNLSDNTELYEMSKADGDFDGLAAIEAEAAKLRDQTVEQLEFRRMFSNPADPLNCFIDIQAGAGGTEACDWASMLLRQYLKYCERKGFKAEVMEETEGDVAGIRSATIKVEGDYAFGHLRTETGVHRLVRKSPFDSAGRTPHQLCVAVRLPRGRRLDRDRDQPGRRAHRHLPRQRRRRPAHQQDRLGGAPDAHPHRHRGAVPERPQPAPQPRRGLADAAQPALRARDAQAARAQQKLEDSKTDVGWGHQIRSYVLDQSRIKDLRTNVEISNTQKVLDGDLDTFIEASLKQGPVMQALLFDLDGTLIDSMPLHHAAWRDWHAQQGLPFDEDGFFAATAGRTNAEILADLYPAGRRGRALAMAETKEALYRERRGHAAALIAGALTICCTRARARAEAGGVHRGAAGQHQRGLRALRPRRWSTPSPAPPTRARAARPADAARQAPPRHLCSRPRAAWA